MMDEFVALDRYDPEEIARAFREDEAVQEFIRQHRAANLEQSREWDEDCSTCVHEPECSEVGGRQEGRGFGAACHPSFGEVPHYERKEQRHEAR